LRRLEFKSLQFFLHKLVFGTLTILGAGYILANLAMVAMLIYFLSLYSMTSVQVIVTMSGLLLFLFASILLIAVGILLIFAGIRSYKGSVSKGMVVLGVLLGSFYLLCLSVGSVLLSPELNVYVILLILSPIFLMLGTAAYVLRSFRSRLLGSILGVVGGVLLAIVVFTTQIFKFAFIGWDVPFLGPFMSMAFVEGAAIILGAIGVFVHSVLAENRKGPVTYIFLPIATLIYGIGVFIGPLILSFSFLDLLWKAPWVGPLHDAPSWVLGTMTFWSASLVMLEIAGILLIVTSYVGFFFAFSAIEK